MTIHLVILTNPMAMRGSFREIVPVGPLTVRFQVSSGNRIASIRLLNRGLALRPGTTVEVPQIGLHEVIAIDLA